MNQRYTLIFITFLVISVFYFGKAQTTFEKQNEVVIYSNSFESPQDTVGLQRNGMIDFNSDVPLNGGIQSLYVSGGCIWPHAQIELGPFEKDGFYKVKCWGKNLQVGGSVSIDVEGKFFNGAIINIGENEWTFYESAGALYCPAGKKIVLSIGAGGIVGSAMLIDNVEIVSVKSTQSQWVIRDSGTMERLNDVMMLDSVTAIVVGDSGSILKTTDSGITWRNTAPQLDCVPQICIIKWNSILFYDSLNGIVAGESAVLITSDGGENWQFLNSPSGNNFISIGKVGLYDIYIGDDSGTIYNSLDTGKTWTSEHIADLPIRSIYPYPGPTLGGSLVLYALTTYSLFTKGFYDPSWHEWGPLGYFYGLGGSAFKGGFSEDGTEYIVGTEGDFIAQSTIIRLRLMDSHWYSVAPANEFGELYGLSIPSSSIIYTCGTGGKILKSANGGDNWVSLKTLTTQALHSINFFDNQRGFAVGDSGMILYTENGGTSSTNFPPSTFHLLEPINGDTLSKSEPITFTWQKAIDLNNDPVYYSLLMSIDSGRTWNSYGPFSDTTVKISVPFGLNRNLWTVIASDGLLATPSSDVFLFNIFSVADVDKSDDAPCTFALCQNYPNPFNPTTKIKFVIPKSSFVNLKVYDAIGNEVATLVDEEKPAGNYQMEFNAANLSSGIYFYKIQATPVGGQAGGFVETKKMILLK